MAPLARSARTRRARVRLLLTLLLIGTTVAGVRSAAADRPDGAGPGRARVIVTLVDQAEPAAVAAEHQRRYGGRPLGVYRHALRGYVADVPARAAAAIAHDPRVVAVEADQVVHALAQTVPTGVDRIEADENATAKIDGVDERVDVDVAVIDTGVGPHSDLVVVGGTRCTSFLGLFPSCGSGSFADGNGHGTHVAGTIGAKDDANGVVGVAPGARIHAVKALSAAGTGFLSQIIASIDWVTARAATIEVANMSVGAEGSSAAMDTAINNSTAAGVVYVVAAGNASKDASTTIPAKHPKAITVSAMTDFNGLPGGGAPPTCRADVDDTFADFSNYGPAVDLAAPGVCILSTWLNGGYNTISGTSMASPHGTGAAAAYIAANQVPRSSSRWSTVRSALIGSWSVPQDSACGFIGGKSSEPMLLVAAC